MKKIDAIIKPFKLDEVKEQLNDIGIEGMTILEARGFGHQLASREAERLDSFSPDVCAQIKIEVFVADERAAVAVEAILRAANTGKPGAGKIFVSSVEEAVRIRTGERGERAA